MIEIVLYRKRVATEFVATIDDADLPLITGVRWSLFTPRGSKTHYARSTIGGKIVYMHRRIMGAIEGDEIDYIDGNGLTNTRENMRFVTRSENIRSAHRLPGRYGNLTIEELDAELAKFDSRQNAL